MNIISPTYIGYNITATGDSSMLCLIADFEKYLPNVPFDLKFKSEGSIRNSKEVVGEFRKKIKERIYYLEIQFAEYVKKIEMYTDKNAVYIGSNKQKRLNEHLYNVRNLDRTIQLLQEVLETDKQFLDILSDLNNKEE